jgi:hypothetical protein
MPRRLSAEHQDMPRFVFLLTAACALLLAACGGKPSPATTANTTGTSPALPPASCPSGQARLTPQDGIYFGVNLDWEKDSPADYAVRLGQKPAVYVLFAEFPLSAGAEGYVNDIANQVAAQGGALMLTLEPNSGLDAVTPASAVQLAVQMASINQRGVPVYLRFAHEMNGSWYAWSQDPQGYVRSFREVAAAVHAQAPATAMVWAPNYGGGYPFIGGKYVAVPGSTAYATLDSNGDGALSMADDTYAPYYPGDDAVDWVGMSLYHWGSRYPWGENELPEPGKLAAQLTGAYRGFNGDDTPLTDFYADYSVARGKPLAITETAAFYAVGQGDDNEARLKQAWWQQVFDPELARTFPNLKMINWFEWRKFEAEVGDEVDWTVTRDPELLRAFQVALPSYLRFAEGGAC